LYGSGLFFAEDFAAGLFEGLQRFAQGIIRQTFDIIAYFGSPFR
jgi:hypothetical protein